VKRGRFQFRFERLARIRSIQESVARSAWSEAERAARDAHARLADLRGEIAAARARTSAEQAAGRLSPRAVLASDRAHGSMLSALTRLRGRELRLRGTADAERRTWAERDRECESLARLREREAARHRVEREELAARELDEIAIGRTRYGRPGPLGRTAQAAPAGGREARQPGSSRPAGAADTDPSGPGRPAAGDPR
jgi:flagellar export protein FliJ